MLISWPTHFKMTIDWLTSNPADFNVNINNLDSIKTYVAMPNEKDNPSKDQSPRT